MNLLKDLRLTVVGISVVGILTHIIPHDMGVSTVGAVGMLAAAYLPRKLILIPILATVFIVDAMNGFYALLAMSFVYLAHVLAGYSTQPILKSVRPITVAGASVASALVFYLVSNITPMAMGYYPMTLEGWAICYVNALPFLLKGILANLAFGGVFFGVVWLVRENLAHRLAASQRN